MSHLHFSLAIFQRFLFAAGQAQSGFVSTDLGDHWWFEATYGGGCKLSLGVSGTPFFVIQSVYFRKTFCVQEMPGLDWMEKFWNRALTAPPASRTLGFRRCGNICSYTSERCWCLLCLSLFSSVWPCRTLANWVGVFNRWQAMGGWKPGQAPKLDFAIMCQAWLWSWREW